MIAGTDRMVRVVTCTSDAPWEPPLVHGLQRHELGVELVRRCVDHGELLGVALRDRPRAAIVAADLPWLDRELVGTLQEHGVAVIAIDARGTRPLDRIGVTHRLDASATADDVAALLHRLEAGARPDGPASPAPPARPAAGRLVAVWGGAGSPGRTTVAVHTAVALAETGRRALLVDADVWAASIAQLLELRESPSLAQAARLAADGWPQPLASCVQPGPGIDVIPGLARAELWPEVREHAWRAVLDAARAEHDCVVVDLAAPIEEDEELSFDRVPYRRNLVTRVALELADTVLLVVAADPIGLRRGIVAHRTLAGALPRAAGRAVVLLNRAPSVARRVQEASAAVSEWTGHPPRAILPVEPAFERVVWEGRPVTSVRRRSRWLRELRASVASSLAAAVPA